MKDFLRPLIEIVLIAAGIYAVMLGLFAYFVGY